MKYLNRIKVLFINSAKLFFIFIGGSIIVLFYLIFGLLYGSLSPFLLILQLLELITVFPIYYIVTGKSYYYEYHSIIEMYFDFVFFNAYYKRGKDIFNDVFGHNLFDFLRFVLYKLCEIKIKW